MFYYNQKDFGSLYLAAIKVVQKGAVNKL